MLTVGVLNRQKRSKTITNYNKKAWKRKHIFEEVLNNYDLTLGGTFHRDGDNPYICSGFYGIWTIFFVVYVFICIEKSMG